MREQYARINLTLEESNYVLNLLNNELASLNKEWENAEGNYKGFRMNDIDFTNRICAILVAEMLSAEERTNYPKK